MILKLHFNWDERCFFISNNKKFQDSDLAFTMTTDCYTFYDQKIIITSYEHYYKIHFASRIKVLVLIHTENCNNVPEPK